MIRRRRSTGAEVRLTEMLRELSRELMSARADERRAIREYLALHMGHCHDCSRAVAAKGSDPWDRLPPCDCHMSELDMLFDDYGKKAR